MYICYGFKEKRNGPKKWVILASALTMCAITTSVENGIVLIRDLLFSSWCLAHCSRTTYSIFFSFVSIILSVRLSSCVRVLVHRLQERTGSLPDGRRFCAWTNTVRTADPPPPPRPLTPVVTPLVVTTLVFVCSVCVCMCVCVFVFWLTAERPLVGNVFQFLPWFVCFWNLVFGICCCCCWRPIIQPLGFDTHELCISSSSKLQDEALGHLVGDWNYLYWCTPLMLKWFRLLCYYSDIQNCIKRYPFFIFKKVPHQLIHQRKCAFIFWLPPATLQNTPRGIRTVI